jgi:hypothetical protein
VKADDRQAGERDVIAEPTEPELVGGGENNEGVGIGVPVGNDDRV